MLSFNQINKLSQKLFQKNIETRRIWRPLNLQSYLKKFETYNISNANKFYLNSLCVPSDDKLLISDIDKISNYIIKYYNIVKSNRNL
jgi:dTDP-4-amino-4,6-dideoxygalactose transaminase